MHMQVEMQHAAVSSNKLYNRISFDRNLLLGVIWRKKQGRKISWSVGLVKSLTIRYYWSSSRRKRRSTLPLWSIICGKECQIPLRIKVSLIRKKYLAFCTDFRCLYHYLIAIFRVLRLIRILFCSCCWLLWVIIQHFWTFRLLYDIRPS